MLNRKFAEPRAFEAPAMRPAPGLVRPEVSVGSARISPPGVVLVGDLENQPVDLRRLLTEAGIRVHAVGPVWRWICENEDADVDAVVVVAGSLPIALRYCELASETQNRPVIFCAPEAEDGARRCALEAGADTFVCMRASDELALTIRSIWRRRLRTRQTETHDRSVLTYRGWRLDLARQCIVSPTGRSAALPRRSLGILTALFVDPGRVLTADEVADAAGIPVGAAGIGVYIHRIRRVLARIDEGPSLVVNVRGKGFCLYAGQ